MKFCFRSWLSLDAVDSVIERDWLCSVIGSLRFRLIDPNPAKSVAELSCIQESIIFSTQNTRICVPSL